MVAADRLCDPDRRPEQQQREHDQDERRQRVARERKAAVVGADIAAGLAGCGRPATGGTVIAGGRLIVATAGAVTATTGAAASLWALTAARGLGLILIRRGGRLRGGKRCGENERGEHPDSDYCDCFRPTHQSIPSSIPSLACTLPSALDRHSNASRGVNRQLREKLSAPLVWREIRDTPRRLIARRVAAFVGAGGLLAYLAFEGGSYDIVARQQVALVVWALVAIGFALGILPRNVPARLSLVALTAAVGLVFWMALSLTWTESDERTWAEIARVLGYAGFVTLALTGLNRFTFRAAAAGVSAAAIAVVSVAVASRLSPSTFPDALNVAERFSRAERLDYPLDYWNAIGAWGAMTGAICIAWSAHARLALVRVLTLAFVPAAALAVYLSYSRAGVIASAVALIAVVALSLHRWTAFVHALAAGAGAALVIVVARGQDQIADATGGAGAGAVAAALLAAAALCAGAVFLTWILDADGARLPETVPKWVVPALIVSTLAVVVLVGQGEISNAWDEFRTEDKEVVGSDPAERLTTAGGNRNDIWNSALDAFREDPLKGIGPGTFEFWWERTANDPEYLRDAHSLYLEFLGELGVFGFCLLLGVLGGLLAVALAARQRLVDAADMGAHAAMVAAFLVFAVSAGVDWMWEETAVAALGLGAVAIAGASRFPRARGEQRRGPLGRPGARVAVVAVAIAGAAVQVPGLVSSERLRASERALAAGDLGVARRLAEDAVDAQPWSATAHSQLALVERNHGDLEAAIAEISEAIEREPTNWRWPLILAPLQAASGDRPAAIETFREGRKLAPQLAFYDVFSFYGQQIYTVDQLQRIYERRQARAAIGAAELE